MSSKGVKFAEKLPIASPPPVAFFTLELMRFENLSIMEFQLGYPDPLGL